MSNISPRNSFKQQLRTNGSSMAPNNSSVEYYLKGLNAEFKDKVFKLSSKEVFIGRDKSNHIKVEKDLKVSRKHARILQADGKIYIQNLSQNNQIRVNNEFKERAELYNGAVITIGEINFKIVADIKNSPKSAKKQKLLSKDKPVLKVAVALVVVLGIYLNFSTSSQTEDKKVLREIASQESINERLNQAGEELSDLETEISESMKSDPDYKEAQKIYLKGFRNFQKGLYAQAISSFETSLSLYPEHTLARRYNVLSKNRLDELINFHITEGRVHLTNRKYGFCIAAYKNAMAQSFDKSDDRFKEAKLSLNKCETLKRSQY